MLVLSRKAGQAITIGEDITVEVRRVAGNRVTLALQAPKDVRILRGEIAKAVDSFQEQGPAAASSPTQTITLDLPAVLATA